MAAVMLPGRATPRPAMSKAAPWSGDMRGNGRPRVAAPPSPRPTSLTGMRPWSGDMATPRATWPAAGHAPAGDVEGGPVVGGHAGEGQAEGARPPFVPAEQLDRDVSLVVVHGHHEVDLAGRGPREQGVRGQRSVRVDVLGPGPRHRG